MKRNIWYLERSLVNVRPDRQPNVGMLFVCSSGVEEPSCDNKTILLKNTLNLLYSLLWLAQDDIGSCLSNGYDYIHPTGRADFRRDMLLKIKELYEN